MDAERDYLKYQGTIYLLEDLQDTLKDDGAT
jgi:hypothetical protein